MRKYIEWVKKQPCCHCRVDGPNDPHHLISFGRGIMGGKAHDIFAVPLCRSCHELVHREHHRFRSEWNETQMAWLHETLKKAIDDGILEVK